MRVTAPDYSPELAARLSKLESAISKQRTIQFRYWSPARDRETERRLNPYALRLDEGVWYVVGHDLDRDATRTFRVARIRSDIRFATRRERDFRLPAEFDVEAHRIARPWQIGTPAGVARIGVQGDTAWWVDRTLADAGAVVDGVFETGYATLGPLVSWILRQNGRAVPLDPPELRDEVRAALKLLRERHKGAAPETARERRAEARPPVERQPAGPVAPERFGVLQALLAHLLAACGDDRTAELDADELAERFSLPREELQETLSLLNLVNFGGGCYTVYAMVDEDASSVRVDKELYGDVFRKAPKLTPLEARAIRLAIEYVGPTIAAEADTPLERVRRKLDETFGQFELASPAATRAGEDEEELVRVLADGVEKRRLVELEYLKEGEEEPTTRLVEPYTIERELPFWRVHTWDRTVDGPRTYRLDRMRSARLTREPLRATGRLRSELPRRAGRRPALARAADRPLEAGARRTGPDGPVGRLGRHVQDGGVAPLRGARRPWRDRGARARVDAACRRRTRPGAPGGARAQPAAEADGRESLNRAPGPGSAARSSDPPCASAIVRATQRPSPLEPAPLTPRAKTSTVGSTPGPSSATSTTTTPSCSPTPIVTLEPWRSPFATRLESTWRRRVGSPSTIGRPATETSTPSARSSPTSAATSTCSRRREPGSSSVRIRSMSRAAAIASASARDRSAAGNPAAAPASAANAATGLRNSCATSSRPSPTCPA